MSRSHAGELKQDKQNSGSYSAQGGHAHNHSKSVDSAVESARAPNIAQRVREEFVAIQQSLHEQHDKQHSSQQLRKRGGSENMHEKQHSSSSQQVGKRSVSENMDVADVKSPDMLQRLKEEVEAVGEMLHEKDSKGPHTTQQHDHEDANPGCWTGMGKALERICGGKKA